MTTTYIRALLFSFVAGIAVPCSIEFGGRYLNAMRGPTPLWLSTVFIYIWPTSLWLIGTSADLRSYIAFTISVVANGLLYGLITFVVCYLIKLFKNPHEDSWWPGASGSRR